VELSEVSRLYEAIEDETRRAFIGQDDVLGSVLVAIFARGHVLLEGVPGVGKTLLVRVLGQVLGCHFRRVQFTPDLMPSDVTGSTLYNSQKGAFEFKHGPVFTHIMLADEVNRAPAKTQSAMLEAMAERSVTVDGVTHPLPMPFFVLATQNPLESAGTYALPEAQLDRFLFKVLIDHPTLEYEEQLLRNVRDGFDAADLEAMQLRRITTPEIVIDMQRSIQTVQIDDKIINYIATLVANTRKHRAVHIGASPRAAIALLHTARVEAAVQGRNFVVPDDVKTHGRAVLRHRIILQPDAEIEGVTSDEVIEGVLHETQVPGMGERAGERRGRGPLAPGEEAARSSAGKEAGIATHQVRERGTIPAVGPGSTSQRPAGSPLGTPPRSGAFSQAPSHNPPSRPAIGGAPAARSARDSKVPDDVTLLDAKPPAPSAPAMPTMMPSGSAPARPAGLDPDTIPPVTVRPLGSNPPHRGGGSQDGSG
jgi:MoxR-like ATPase